MALLAVHNLELGTYPETNANVKFGWFSYSDWLGAVTDLEDGVQTLRSGSPEIEMGGEIIDVGGGKALVDLREHGAPSQNGILLANHAENLPLMALTEALLDGTFELVIKGSRESMLFFFSLPGLRSPSSRLMRWGSAAWCRWAGWGRKVSNY